MMVRGLPIGPRQRPAWLVHDAANTLTPTPASDPIAQATSNAAAGGPTSGPATHTEHHHRASIAGVLASLGLDPKRWGYAVAGVLFVALAAAGVLLPGVPTTIFLILASWCFTRSCPVLERVLIRNRFFGPFLASLSGDQPMPRKAQVVSLAMMWTAIVVSSGLILSRTAAPNWILPIVVVAGLVGTWYIVRAGRVVPPASGDSQGEDKSTAPAERQSEA